MLKQVSVIPDKARTRRKREPFVPDPESFGYGLLMAIGGPACNKSKAARFLNMTPQAISDVIADRRKISAKYARELAPQIALHFPDRWREYGPLYMENIKYLRQQVMPEDNGKIGYVIWLIAGGANANLERAARLFGITRTYLWRDIILKGAISQNNIIGNDWPGILAENFPENWKQYKDAFEARLKLLAPAPNAPRHGNSPGYTLWLILKMHDGQHDGKIDLDEISGKIGFRKHHLLLFLRNKRIPSQEYTESIGLFQKLMDHYPEGWRKYGETFQMRLKKAQEQPTAHILQKWKQTVGELVTHIRTKRGDDIDDLLPDIDTAQLKDAKTWKEIEKGKSNDCALYIAALTEVCKLYNLTKEHDSSAQDYNACRRLKGQYAKIKPPALH